MIKGRLKPDFGVSDGLCIYWGVCSRLRTWKVSFRIDKTSLFQEGKYLDFQEKFHLYVWPNILYAQMLQIQTCIFNIIKRNQHHSNNICKINIRPI